MKSYPISREKVEDLKIRIQKTSFWDNIVARPYPKKKRLYQIAYGHHRLIALRELKIKEVDIPIRNLDNSTMLIMMADENLNQDPSLAVMNETVYTVKDYLDKEFAKYDKFKDLPKLLLNLVPKKNQASLAQVKRDGVGQPAILIFLNGGKEKGNWTKTPIADALALKEEDKAGEVDKEAVEQLEKPYQARQFRTAVKNYKIPKTEQKKLAKKIKKHKIGGREIPKVVRKSVKKKLVNVINALAPFT